MDIRVYAGRALIITGIIIILFGVAIMFSDRIPMMGRLPGDITVRGRNWTLYFPIASAIILSIVLSVILNLFFRR